MVNAWASRAGVALAQLRTDYEKRNEKEAFRDIIDFLELEGALVTIDANGAHASITNKIVEKKGSFLVALKRNQKSLLKSVEEEFEGSSQDEKSFSETVDKGHGRIEKRSCEALNLSDLFLKNLNKKNHKRGQEKWKGLRSVCKITRERKIKETITIEKVYYISSLAANSSKMLEAVRSHWGIENKLHWALDVSFNEDSCRVRNGYAGENFAVIRQLALNLIKQEKTTKKSIKSKRLMCGWENDFLVKVISGMTSESMVV
jgi:predicted transposase YbfD/YdcC